MAEETDLAGPEMFALAAVAACAYANEMRGVPTIGDNVTVPVRVRRFVHRHACVGVDGDGGDTIGCAEAHAATFEHMLTPSQLWCNERDCLSDFNKTFTVHSIACTPLRCAVLLHCSEALEAVKHSVLLTLVAIVVLIFAPLYLASPGELFAAARMRWAARTSKQL